MPFNPSAWRKGTFLIGTGFRRRRPLAVVGASCGLIRVGAVWRPVFGYSLGAVDDGVAVVEMERRDAAARADPQPRLAGDSHRRCAKDGRRHAAKVSEYFCSQWQLAHHRRL